MSAPIRTRSWLFTPATRPERRILADGLHERVGLRFEDLVVNLVEVKRENWSFGNGEAQLV